MIDTETQDGGPSGWTRGLVGAAGAACVVGGLELVGTLKPTAVTGGVLLLVASLGLLATAVGGAGYGPESEGRLDLSTRLAAGVLGGVLGGIAHLLAAWALGVADLPGLLGVDLAVWLTPGELAGRAASGALWGLAFGVFHPWLPGGDSLRRGLYFSAAPALWTLAVVFPDLKYGLFGVELGVLTFVVVGVHHLVWGAVTGAVVRWAERTELAPLSRPLGA